MTDEPSPPGNERPKYLKLKEKVPSLINYQNMVENDKSAYEPSGAYYGFCSMKRLEAFLLLPTPPVPIYIPGWREAL